MRGHDPIELKEFNGLWQQGDDEECPKDHFTDCENIRFVGFSSFGSRFGIGIHQSVSVPLGNVVRTYNYITQDKNTLLVLTYNATDGGELYHVVDSTTVFGPILSIQDMEDFAFAPFAGRAYISPFKSFPQGGSNPPIEKGLQNEFLYVYLGNGTAAQKAGGTGSGSGNLTASNSGSAGQTGPGLHLFGVVGETNTGFLSPPFGFDDLTTLANQGVTFTGIPVLTGAQWVKRHIVATKVIENYNGNTTGYQYLFIPNATLNDNTTTNLVNVSFFDQDLLDDASYLLDNFSEIPAGAGLTIFQNRLVLWTTFNDISLALVSAVGEPEAINQLKGILIVPLDGNPITNGQELRDLLYLTKRNRTVSYVDNGDIPSSWPMTVIDQAIGAPVHGIATVIDSGGTSVDFLIIASYVGIVIFNGRYIMPELSWKISEFWKNQNRNDFRFIQMVNDPINKIIYCVLPDRRLLIGDYKNGMELDKIRWTPLRADFTINTIALVNTDQLIIGAEENFL